MSAINLKGKAVTANPSIVVNFRSYATGCEEPTTCAVEVSDTVLRQGQGMHGSFNRGDTMNFMAAAGPDFKAGYVDALPVSNADVGMTAAKLLGLHASAVGDLTGRVMSEALPNGSTPKFVASTISSKPDPNGLQTVLKFQHVQSQRYFDVAGFSGRTLGLDADKQKRRGNSPTAFNSSCTLKPLLPLQSEVCANFGPTCRCQRRSAGVTAAARRRR
jgi:hypothetical protein